MVQVDTNCYLDQSAHLRNQKRKKKLTAISQSHNSPTNGRTKSWSHYSRSFKNSCTGFRNSIPQITNVHFQPSDEDGRAEEEEDVEEGSEMKKILDDLLMNGIRKVTLPRLGEEDVAVDMDKVRWMMIGVRATAMGQIMMSCKPVIACEIQIQQNFTKSVVTNA
jgi:hypothetical protein